MQKELQWLKNEKYQGNTPAEFFHDKQRFESGEPIDYIIGTKPFLGVDIDLSYHPFIPRPETEYWVETILTTIPKSSAIDILDLFSGSGCIGVALAHHLSNAHIDCTDNNINALQQIQKNVALNHLQKQVHTLKSDVYSNITKKYDYIFANPPYISSTSHCVHSSVLKHEPHDALFAEKEGMYYIEQTILNASQYLKPQGSIFIEHDPEQTQHIHSLSQEFKAQTHKDQYGVDRMTKLST